MLLLPWAAAAASAPYQRFKLEIVALLHLTKDAIHVYVGVGCLLLVLLLTGGRARWRALLAGLVLALAMEAADLGDEWQAGRPLRWGASLHDVLNTNALPVALMFVLRRREGTQSRTSSPPA